MKLMLNGKEVSGMGHYVMAGDIKDATAEDRNVLSGKVYYNNNGKREGTMPNRGGMSAELAAGGSVSIPEGYHDGTGSVRAKATSLVLVTTLTTNGTATTYTLDANKTYLIISCYYTETNKADICIFFHDRGTTTVLLKKLGPAFGEASINNNILTTGEGHSSVPCETFVYEVS